MKRISPVDVMPLYVSRIMGALGDWYRFEKDESPSDDMKGKPTLIMHDDDTVTLDPDFCESGYIIGGYCCFPKVPS